MKIIKGTIVLTLLLLVTFSLKAQNTAADFTSMNYEVQFIRTGLDGTILFKIFSYGKNEDQAIQNSKSDALKAVMFKGIPGSDLVNPMVRDLSALETHKEFFQTFFQTQQYLQYVSISNDGSIDGEDRLKVGKKYKIGVVVSVQKAQLRKLLEAAGIIKALNAGF
jgi:hypothetical protein